MPASSPARLDLPPTEVRCGVGLHGPGSERFSLDGRWQLHVYPYAARLEVAGGELAIRPGTLTLVPPGVRTCYRFPARVSHRWAHLRLAPGPADAALPLLVDDPALAALAGEAVDAALDWQHGQPARAAARLWDLLWRLAEPLPGSAAGDQALRRAVAHAEANLARPLRIAELARAAGCPHNRLIRLFRNHLGASPLAWLRQRRAAAAAYLIRATDRPLAAIAAEVGLPDRQHFNKVMRRELGCPPSRLRAKS